MQKSNLGMPHHSNSIGFMFMGFSFVWADCWSWLLLNLLAPKGAVGLKIFSTLIQKRDSLSSSTGKRWSIQPPWTWRFLDGDFCGPFCGLADAHPETNSLMSLLCWCFHSAMTYSRQYIKENSINFTLHLLTLAYGNPVREENTVFCLPSPLLLVQCAC